jgi:TolA-binding protein
LRFSDGSSVVAKPHTTTRVMHLSPDGAQLALERGDLEAHVIHREGSRWQVAAVPFVVHVTGTRFHVRWDPQAEKAMVSVSEGRVEVTGGNQPLHVLTAGSALVLSADVSPAPSAAGSATPSIAPPAATDASSEATPEPAGDEDELIRPRKAEHKPDFRELSTEGRYREALAAVEQAGFGQQCETLSARDLLTLGSTARLAGRPDRARDAYLAARRRFPRSAEASISAFSLGRLASDSGHASDAKGWFQRYLSEQPNGPLAREAAGRLIEALRQAGSTTEAKAAAESYLKRYPNGPHAALAQSLLAR